MKKIINVLFGWMVMLWIVGPSYAIGIYDTTASNIDSYITDGKIILDNADNTLWYADGDDTKKVYIEAPDGTIIDNYTGTSFLNISCRNGYITKIFHDWYDGSDWHNQIWSDYWAENKVTSVVLHYDNDSKTVPLQCSPGIEEIYACPEDSQELNGCNLLVDSGTAYKSLLWNCWNTPDGDTQCQLTVLFNWHWDDTEGCVEWPDADWGGYSCYTGDSYTTKWNIYSKLYHIWYFYKDDVWVFNSLYLNWPTLNNLVYKIKYTDWRVSDPVIFYKDRHDMPDNQNGDIAYTSISAVYSKLNAFKYMDNVPLTICYDKNCDGSEDVPGVDLSMNGGYVHLKPEWPGTALSAFDLTLVPVDYPDTWTNTTPKTYDELWIDLDNTLTIWDIRKKLYNSVEVKSYNLHEIDEIDCADTGNADVNWTWIVDGIVNKMEASGLNITVISTGFHNVRSNVCRPYVDIKIDLWNNYSQRYIKLPDYDWTYHTYLVPDILKIDVTRWRLDYETLRNASAFNWWIQVIDETDSSSDWEWTSENSNYNMTNIPDLPSNLVERFPASEIIWREINAQEDDYLKHFIYNGHITDTILIDTWVLTTWDLKIIDNSWFVYDVKLDPLTNQVVQVLNCNPEKLDLSTLPQDKLTRIVACQLKKTTDILRNKDYVAWIVDTDIPLAYKAVFTLLLKWENDINVKKLEETIKEIERKWLKPADGVEILNKFILGLDNNDESTNDSNSSDTSPSTSLTIVDDNDFGRIDKWGTTYADITIKFSNEIEDIDISSENGGSVSNIRINGDEVLFDYTTPNVDEDILFIQAKDIDGNILETDDYYSFLLDI